MGKNQKGKHGKSSCSKILLTMKLMIVFLLLTFTSFASLSMGQQTTIKLANATLKDAFKEIKRQMGYSFIYNEEVVKQAGTISVEITSEDIREVISICLKGTTLEYYIQGDVVVIRHKNEALEQVEEKKSLVITGHVYDNSGQSLPGVTVLLKGTSVGTSTDVDGAFSLKIPRMDRVTLVFSFVGMQQKEYQVKELKQDIPPLSITLEAQDAELKEVVVTGIFNRKKEGFTGSAVTVKGEDLKKISTTSIAKALATIDPSFRIMDDILNGSDPNRLPDMRMRGQATLPPGTTNSVDMVSLQGEYDTYPNQPLLILDGFEINVQTFVDLDPDRIASATILKDAAATAIYGSKAANGVIIIETVTPLEGEIHVTYGGNIRFQMPDLSGYNLMNSAEKLEAEMLAGLYPENNLTAMQNYQTYLREMKRGVDTYWLAQPLRTAVQQRHSLSLEGGSRELRYRLYVGLNNTPGVMKESGRNTQTGSLDLSYRVKKFLIKNTITLDNSVGDNSPYGSFRQYTMLNPYLRPYGENGEILRVMQIWDMSNVSGGSKPVVNPMYNATFHSLDRSSAFSVRDIFRLEYIPTNDLRIQANVSLEKSVGKTEVFRPAQHTAFADVTDPTLKGDFRRRQSEGLNYSFDLTGSYNRSINNLHLVTANLRFELQQRQSEFFQALVTGFPNDNMDHILFGKKYNENMSGAEETIRTISGVGTFGYTYNRKYAADFNIRIDGSSQFGSNNRFAPFWSAGLRWNAKNENFLQEVSWLEDMVLRASYGITGTQGFPAYQSQQLYSYQDLLKPYLASDGTGVELVALGNPDLKWQQTGTWNLAVEASLFEGRFTARMEYFVKNTINSLINITLAPSNGFSSYPENLGTIENRGMELNFSFIPYRNREKQAYWVITLNGSHNEDKIQKIGDALRVMNEINKENLSDVPLPQYVEGESMNRIWGVRSLGIDPATGDEILVKRDGGLTTEYDPVDLIPMGNTEPKWQGNINTNFNYRGFGFNLGFNYKFGGQVYNETLVRKIENIDLRNNADRRVLEQRWVKAGDRVKYKAITNSVNGSETRATSRFVMDENTFRMGSLSLTYKMDGSNTGFLKKTPITSMKWSFNMEDVFYLSSVKQERGIDYPFARQFSLSLNLVF